MMTEIEKETLIRYDDVGGGGGGRQKDSDGDKNSTAYIGEFASKYLQ